MKVERKNKIIIRKSECQTSAAMFTRLRAPRRGRRRIDAAHQWKGLMERWWFGRWSQKPMCENQRWKWMPLEIWKKKYTYRQRTAFWVQESAILTNRALLLYGCCCPGWWYFCRCCRWWWLPPLLETLPGPARMLRVRDWWLLLVDVLEDDVVVATTATSPPGASLGLILAINGVAVCEANTTRHYVRISRVAQDTNTH